MSDLTITEADVASFRDKLDDWAATLSDGEQAILAMVAARAFPDSGPDDDVQGFASPVTFNPFSITRKVDRSSPVFFEGSDLESMVGIHVSFGISEARSD